LIHSDLLEIETAFVIRTRKTLPFLAPAPDYYEYYEKDPAPYIEQAERYLVMLTGDATPGPTARPGGIGIKFCERKPVLQRQIGAVLDPHQSLLRGADHKDTAEGFSGKSAEFRRIVSI
jgi:hypothetical protein